MVSILAVWMVAMLLPTSASAQFRLRIEDMVSGQGVVVTDLVGTPTGAGDLNGAPGLISVMLFNLGNVTLSLTTGQTSNYGVGIATTGAVAETRMNSVTLATLGPATLRLTLEDTSYPFDGSTNVQVDTQVLNLAFAATGGGTLTTQSWANVNPLAVPDLGVEQTSIGTLNPIGNAAAFTTGHGTGEVSLTTASTSIGGELFGEGTSAVFAASGPFSLFTQLVVDIRGDSGGSLSFDQVTTVLASSELVLPGDPTPEPGSLLLIVTGVMGLGTRMRRRLFTRG
jgi:hypothetical protein